MRWSGDGDRLYFIGPQDTLTVVDLRTDGDSLRLGHPETLSRLGRLRNPGFDYAPSRDGERFLVNAAAMDGRLDEPTLVLGWARDLER